MVERTGRRAAIGPEEENRDSLLLEAATMSLSPSRSQSCITQLRKYEMEMGSQQPSESRFIYLFVYLFIYLSKSDVRCPGFSSIMDGPTKLELAVIFKLSRSWLGIFFILQIATERLFNYIVKKSITLL